MSMLWIPEVERETNRGVTVVNLYSHHLKNRKIFLTGEIQSVTAEHIMIQLLHLEEEAPGESIDLYINSPGGEVQSGLMIYDVLQGMVSPVNMYCVGQAASMAAFILAGGQKGRRFILPHGKTMLHEPLISQGVGGSASSIKDIADRIMDTREILFQILEKHTGKTMEELENAIRGDLILNARESVEFGICDRVVSGL